MSSLCAVPIPEAGRCLIVPGMPSSTEHFVFSLRSSRAVALPGMLGTGLLLRTTDAAISAPH